ncbi:MAG TPA: hypothetical protein VIH40_08365, partial [Xanthobacteraceae bacterium]
MSDARFLPSARQANWLIAIGFLSLGYALYLRYLVIENVPVGLACDSGLKTWLCLSRTVAAALAHNGVFGWVALGAAAIHFVRPSVVLFAIALAVTAFGLVLFDASLSGLAG